jgi:hypothetical protein
MLATRIRTLGLGRKGTEMRDNVIFFRYEMRDTIRRDFGKSLMGKWAFIAKHGTLRGTRVGLSRAFRGDDCSGE